MPDALKNPINALADVYSGTEAPNFCLSVHLHSYLAYASNEGSGESAYLRRLARAFVVQQCDTYRCLMYRLNILVRSP